jgi:ferredoxin-thioredoxin reductase catalytic subunit
MSKKIIINMPQKEAINFLLDIKENGGYCPCSIEKTDDTKCMCKEFRETGVCHCGLYKYSD